MAVPDVIGILCQSGTDVPTLAEVSRRYVAAVVIRSGGNKSRAARLLGVSRRSLYRWLAAEGS